MPSKNNHALLKHIQWRSKLDLQFPKFQGHCLLLFEVILAGVEGQFLKHISKVKYILKHSIKKT